MRKLAAIALLTLIFVISQVSAQPGPGPGPSTFNVDFASFTSDSAGYTLVEAYYMIYTSKLLHVRQEGHYMAQYSVNAVIRDGRKQIAATEREDVVYAETYEDTKNPRDYIINQLRFYLKPGRYKVTVTLNDKNSAASIPLETNLDVPAYQKENMQISQIEFLRQVDLALDSSAFDKGQWRVIPSCSRRYGDGVYWLRFYFELYNSELFIKPNITFNYEVRNDNNQVVKNGASEFPIGQQAFYIDSLKLDNLKPGSYDLVIYSFNNNGDIFRRLGKFTIQWSAMELLDNDFEGAIDQLKYVANAGELDSLESASDEDRAKRWNAFWKTKDPNPDTDENEIKDEYYRRINYANSQYSIPGKDGWRTDMGMIHVINGKPDEIERHPFDLETKPYEIWYYYNNPRRRFLFIDENGYGEYLLQYPYDGDVNKSINIYGG